ncbi:hypothetical protein M0D21_07905 [Aquimarina sp. D1M17]|nr:hypothetical protein [Aquimarina acroporae]MCK8521487.1 hypothetical protein [Aquimarina acroporae]
MKKLELKRITVVKLSRDQYHKIKGGEEKTENGQLGCHSNNNNPTC